MRRPEQDLQRACVQLLQIYESLGKLTFAHVPNGGKRGKVEAAIMKGLGVRAGFPDFIICWEGGGSGFIELKSEVGRLSANQAAWREKLKHLGHNWDMVRDISELEVALKMWGGCVMGDCRRFDLFAKFIANNFPDREAQIADVAGGKGYLQMALRDMGYRNITTFDKRRTDKRAARSLNYHYGWFHYQTDEKFSLVIGMHPDEGTDHIIKYAQINRVPFCVCPCCTKPSAAPFWKKNTYRGWVDHLKEMAAGCDLMHSSIKIQGRNEILSARGWS